MSVKYYNTNSLCHFGPNERLWTGRSPPKYYMDVSFASLLSIQHFLSDLPVCKLSYFPQSHGLFVKYSCNNPFIVCQNLSKWFRRSCLFKDNVMGLKSPCRLFWGDEILLAVFTKMVLPVWTWNHLKGITFRPSPYCVGTNKRCEVQFCWPIKRSHFVVINNKYRWTNLK